MVGKCTLEGVLSGLIEADHLLKLNALMDMQETYEAYHYERSK
jgi:hypothetical protein